MRKVCAIISIIFLMVVFATAQPGASFLNQVNEISKGSDSAGRGAAIRKRLESIGVKYCVEPFTAGEKIGWNIIAEIPNPKATKTIMLGAHYDRIETGAGAIDNASGSAAVLELLTALKAKPLQNFAVKAAFFDLEEIGLVGSQEYIKARQVSELPTVFLNFDVFGYGDTLWVLTTDDKSKLAQSVSDAAKAANFSASIGTKYPPSDHLSFIKAKVETLSFSLVGKDEIENILKVFAGENLKPEQMPRVMSIIHSTNDTADKIDANAVAKALPVVEQAIRNLDK
jgi:aminopeptidase S